MNNIVFIEGVSGVGKTTTTRLLCAQLWDMGYNVSCCLWKGRKRMTANILGITKNTVKYFTKRIYKKLEVQSKPELNQVLKKQL